MYTELELYTEFKVKNTDFNPKIVACLIKCSVVVDNDLSKYLAETKDADLNVQWLEKCRKVFCSLLTTKPELARGNGEQCYNYTDHKMTAMKAT